MKKFLKITLVSAAVIAAFGVSAGTLTATAVNYSSQGAGVAASNASAVSNSFTHAVNAGYAINDLVTYTITAGAVHSGFVWPATIEFAAGTGMGAGGGSMVLTKLSGAAGDSVAQYRVTTVIASTGQTTIGATSSVTVGLKPSALTAAATISVVSSLSNGVTTIDPTAPATLATSVDQFGDIVVGTKLSKIIDVAQERKAFTSGTSDSISWTSSNNATLTGAVMPTSTVVVLSGDLGELTGAVVSTGATSTKTYNATTKQTTISYTGSVTTDTITITPPTGSAAKVLVAGDFSVAGVVNYAGGSESSGSSVAAGSWTLNGAVVNVPYMPMAATVSRIIYVTNDGTLDAQVSATAFDEMGNSYNLGNIATAKKGAVTVLSQVINAALTAKGFIPVAGNDKVSLTITVNAQDKHITVFAGYNAGTDRVVVPTSQYKKANAS